MSDDLIAGAKWTLENAAGMTLENEEVRQLCDMAERIEQLEAKLARAVEVALEECPFRWGTPNYDNWWRDRRATLAELTGGNNGN